MEKLTELFTPEAELLNGRFAMLGFGLAVLTELLTGVGPVGQILSLFGLG